MKSITVKAAPAQDFFARGKALARLADAGATLPQERVISFEDPADLLGLLTRKRLDVLGAVQREPSSITAIAQQLRRDRSAVKRDVDRLAEAGLVDVQAKVLPGHGLMKEVSPIAARLRLEAVLF